ncbi:MAG: hypothetical protein HFJ26_04135 [Clostridia bacterium]|nr:hypothetical protein [Clostridia bacterium]
MKDYFIKQIEDIKSNPKCIIKKWYFWLIAIAIIYGLITDVFAPKEIITSSNDIEKNIIAEEKTETEEERIAREEKEKKQAEEKAKKERQKRITENSSNAYIYTEKIVKDNLKAPSTAKFSNQKYGYNEEYSRYVVSGSVDSQNSFGAMIRANFYAEYDQDLTMIYFVFDNQVLLDNR